MQKTILIDKKEEFMNKTKEVKMSDYKTYEEFRKAYFKNPDNAKAVKQAMIEEFIESPDMPIEDLLKALKEVIKVEGASKVAKETHLNRENLYRTFSEKGNPRIQTVNKVLNVFGYRIGVFPINPRRCGLAPQSPKQSL
jgi:probable addiction module antidote protein